MKRLFIAIILCGFICCLSSCDKIESDGSENGGGKPIKPEYREYNIGNEINYQDSILYDISVLK